MQEKEKKTPTEEKRETGREFPEKKHPAGTAVEERPDIRGEEKEGEGRKEGEPWKEGERWKQGEMKEKKEEKKEEKKI